MWGGSVENRCRLGLEVLKAMVDVWGPARVGIKISPCGGYNDVGYVLLTFLVSSYTDVTCLHASMPLPDTIHTFTHYITQICAMKLAYVQLVRHNLRFEATVLANVNGTVQKTKRATPHDVLAVYAGIIRPHASLLEGRTEEMLRGPAMPTSEYEGRNPTATRVFVNGGLTLNEAERLIAEGVVDAAVFAVLWICNPDLQKRAERGLPLNNIVDPVTFYMAPEGKDLSYGYTDYPFVDTGEGASS